MAGFAFELTFIQEEGSESFLMISACMSSTEALADWAWLESDLLPKMQVWSDFCHIFKTTKVGRGYEWSQLLGLWDGIRDNRLCGRKDCQYCGHCPGKPVLQLWLVGDNLITRPEQVESGNPGESKELRNAREKFNRVFGVSLGEEDRLVSIRDLQFKLVGDSMYM